MNADYSALCRAVLGQPLAAELTHARQIVAAAIAGMGADDSFPIATLPSAARATSGGFARAIGTQAEVATIPITGLLVSHASPQFWPFVSSLEAITGAVRAAAADPTVRAIVLEVDSAGGPTSGVDETANAIYAARASKPIYAIANYLASGAAAWLATQASAFYVTPSGEAGGIGVYAQHVDLSSALERRGEKTTLIFAGKYKTEGNPFGPLTPDAHAYMQKRVGEQHDRMLEGIARGRNTTPTRVGRDFGEGRVLGAMRAVKSGLADGIATRDQLLRAATKAARQSPSAAFATVQAEMARRTAFQRIEAEVYETPTAPQAHKLSPAAVLRRKYGIPEPKPARLIH